MMPASFLNKRKMNTTAGSVRFQVSPFSRCLAVVVSLCKKKGVLLPKSTHALYRHIKFAFLLTVHVSGSRETDVCRHCHCVAAACFCDGRTRPAFVAKAGTASPANLFSALHGQRVNQHGCAQRNTNLKPPPQKKRRSLL